MPHVWGLSSELERRMVRLLIEDEVDEDERERLFVKYWERYLELRRL